MQMTGNSVMTALGELEEKDVIERHEDEFQIITPVVRYYVSKQTSGF